VLVLVLGSLPEELAQLRPRRWCYVKPAAARVGAPCVCLAMSCSADEDDDENELDVRLMPQDEFEDIFTSAFCLFTSAFLRASRCLPKCLTL